MRNSCFKPPTGILQSVRNKKCKHAHFFPSFSFIFNISEGKKKSQNNTYRKAKTKAETFGTWNCQGLFYNFRLKRKKDSIHVPVSQLSEHIVAKLTPPYLNFLVQFFGPVILIKLESTLTVKHINTGGTNSFLKFQEIYDHLD